MIAEIPESDRWGCHLAAALRPIRKARGLSMLQMASLMGMDRRTYSNFEAGKGQLNLAKVLQFAKATDSDPWAILAGAIMGSPQLARDAADNKVVMTFLILLKEFEAQVGEGVRTIDTAEAISAFRDAFRELEASVALKKERHAADWLRRGAAKIGLGAGRSPDEESDPS